MQDRGALSLLFDLSFTEFITTRIIKVVFVLAIIDGPQQQFDAQCHQHQCYRYK